MLQKNRSVSLMEERHTPVSIRSTSYHLAELDRQSHEKKSAKKSSLKKQTKPYQISSIIESPIRNTSTTTTRRTRTTQTLKEQQELSCNDDTNPLNPRDTYSGIYTSPQQQQQQLEAASTARTTSRNISKQRNEQAQISSSRIMSHNNSSSSNSSYSKTKQIKQSSNNKYNNSNNVSTDTLNRSNGGTITGIGKQNVFSDSKSHQGSYFLNQSYSYAGTTGTHFNSVDTLRQQSTSNNNNNNNNNNEESQKSLSILKKRKESEKKKIDEINQLIRIETDSLRRIESKSHSQSQLRSFSQSSLRKSRADSSQKQLRQSRGLSSQSSTTLSNRSDHRQQQHFFDQLSATSRRKQHTSSTSSTAKKTNTQQQQRSPMCSYNSENKAVQTDINPFTERKQQLQEQHNTSNTLIKSDLSQFTFDHIQINPNLNSYHQPQSRVFLSAKDTAKKQLGSKKPHNSNHKPKQSSYQFEALNNNNNNDNYNSIDPTQQQPLTTYQRILQEHIMRSAQQNAHRKRLEEEKSNHLNASDQFSNEKPIQEQLESIKKELFREEGNNATINNRINSSNNAPHKPVITFERNTCGNLQGFTTTTGTISGTPFTNSTSTSKTSVVVTPAATAVPATSNTVIRKHNQQISHQPNQFSQQSQGLSPVVVVGTTPKNNNLNGSLQNNDMLLTEQTIHFEKSLREHQSLLPLAEKNRQKTDQIKKMNSKLDSDAMYLRTLSEMVNRLDKECNKLGDAIHKHDIFVQERLDLQKDHEQQQNELMLLERDQLTVDTAMRRALEELDYWTAKSKKEFASTVTTTAAAADKIDLISTGYGYIPNPLSHTTTTNTQNGKGQSHRDSLRSSQSSSNNTSTFSMIDNPPILIKLDKAEIYNAAQLSHP